jgi:16S rRNA (adenine1518-N6/adenine1519-N6)-dimethyltransferase
MNFSFKKRFGQNFLVNQHVIYKIVQAVPERFSRIYEIGPGGGALTSLLLKKFDHVTAIEIDKDCIEQLQIKFAYHGNLELINADVLKQDLTAECIIGNLPYNIATKIIEKFLYKPIECGIFMLQREVAQRINGNDYGRFSICVAARYDVSNVIYVHPKDFNPKPKVESQVIKLTRHDRYGNVDMRILNDITKIVFQYPRKKLSWIKKEHPDLAHKMECLGVDFNLRPENVEKDIFFADLFYK